MADEAERDAATKSADEESKLVRRLSARASRADGAAMTEDEMEAAEREAEEWARRVNRC